MCPEQLRSAEVTPGWDLWALSVVASDADWRSAFSGVSIVDCHRAIVGGNFTSIEKVLVDAPRPWNEFFTNSLSPEPAQRPQTATQWLALFEQKVVAATHQARNAP